MSGRKRTEAFGLSDETGAMEARAVSGGYDAIRASGGRHRSCAVLMSTRSRASDV